MLNTDVQNIRIGFVGAGNIAQAMTKGFLSSGLIKPGQISVTAPSDRNLLFYRELGIHTGHDNAAIFAKNSSECSIHVLILAFKPHQLNTTDFKQLWNSISKLRWCFVISALAGIKLLNVISKITGDSSNAKEYCDNNVERGVGFARIMPNVACAHNAGVVGLCCARASDTAYLNSLFSLLGTCQAVEKEDLLNAVTGVAGSGIAFVFTMIQAMSDGGVLCGLPRDVSTKLVLGAIEGAFRMCTAKPGQGQPSPIELRNQVCSPGGTTITGVLALERGRFSATVMEAVEAASKKAQEFASKN